MKKLFSVLALSVGLATLVGCGQQPSASVDKTKVWEQNVYEQLCVFGSNQLEVNGADVDNDWAVSENNVMTAISLNELEQINATLEKKVEKKALLGLYKYEGVVLGTRNPGWRANYKTDDGQVKSKWGSYALKACGVDKNMDEEWVKTCHFSSPESHGESLTPDTLWITDNMTETKVDGFDHDSNPVAKEAGKYTFILALYKKGYGKMNIQCGLGLVKTGERTPAEDPEYPITSMGAIGVNGDWEHDVALTKGADDKFTGTVTLTAAGSFKIRFNGEWSYSLGATALATKVYTNNDGNIEAEAGTYLITVKLGAAAMANFILDQTIEIFTIAPAN
jgi:hypothetical protein